MTEGERSGALDGVRVVELATGIAGPSAAMHLADHGADVVKVEPAGGDCGRRLPGFAVWGRNKRSVSGDPGRWLAGADVIVTDDDPAGLAALHPDAVVLSTPAWLGGPTPWAGGREHHGLLAAASGVAWSQGSVEALPVDHVTPILLYEQGIWAATCAVAALVERQRSERGQAVTVGGAHAAAVAATGSFCVDPAEPPGHRPGGSGGAAPMYRTYPCADGRWLFLAALTPVFYTRAFTAIGADHLLDDPRLEGRWGRMLKDGNQTWVIEALTEIFRRRPRAEWLGLLEEIGVPAGPVKRRDGWLDHPQVRAIEMRAEVDDPERGRVVMPGVPVVLTATPGAVRTAAPAPGEHDGDEPWPPRRSTASPSAGGSQANRSGASDASSDSAGGGPLAGIRVLDLGAIIAGPYAGALLAELGADVVKVEPPAGESFRGAGMLGYNKGLHGLAIDLRSDAGRDALLALVAGADIVIDNYRPGVLARLRLEHGHLTEVNPAVSSVSITGFGEGGPLGEAPGFDPVLQAMAGMMAAQGGDDEPVYLTIPVNDVAAAASAALGAVLAVHAREATGRGQRAWTSLAGMATIMQAGEIVRFPRRPEAPTGERDRLGPSTTDRFVEVAGGWIRMVADDDAGDVVPTDLADRTVAGAISGLTAAGIPATAARRAADVADDPALLAAELVHVVDHPPEGAPPRTAGRLARFSRTPRRGVLTVPGLGEHSREVLQAAGVDPEPLIAGGAVVST